MAVVLVHGVPETVAVWDPLVAELAKLGAEIPIRLAPPGFGSPVPKRWRASPVGYRDWLVTELQQIGEPVHLVGHDWGGAHVLNVAMTRPDLLRSWVSDVPGVFDADYEWHQLAQQWQRPGEGEQAIEALLALSDTARADLLHARGMASWVATSVAGGIDAAMGSCILQLYRAAAQPVMATLGHKLEAAAARPGLAILPQEDEVVGTEQQRHRAAQRAGASVAELTGQGHWWMTTAPADAAQLLTQFWTEHA